MPTQERVHCFVDGYNFYYSLFAYADENDQQDLVWCDYYKLCQQFINPHTQAIRKIYYFSAKYKQEEEEQRQVQQAFIDHHKDAYNQKQEIFRAVWGEFKGTQRTKIARCPQCHRSFTHRFTLLKEKKTDVHIACTALSEAYQNLYEVALLISNDMDFSPLFEQLKLLLEQADKRLKQIILLTPPSADDFSQLLKVYASYTHKIELEHLIKARFNPPPNTPAPRGRYFSRK